MILLNPIVEVLTGTVKDLTAKNAANRPPIGSVLISRHAFRFMSDRRDGLFEKRLGRQQISLFAQQRIDQITVSVDGPIQIAPGALHLHVGFVHIPRFSSLSTTLGAQLGRQQWCKACFPVAHRFMAECITPHRKHLDQVA